MKLNSIFDVIQGHQITDEELYKTEGKIPVLTGRNHVKGHWDGAIIEQNDLPCITYPTKANAGDIYIQTKIFDANNTAVMIPFPEWRDKIDLEWMSYKLRTIFLKVQTSKGGVSYLNKEIVNGIDLNIPSKELQQKEKKRISELLSIKTDLDKILEKINKIKSSHITIDYTNYQGKEISADEIFRCISGNSGLTEEYLYSIMLDGEEKKYQVLTGSIDIGKSLKTYLCPHPKDRTREIMVFSGEGIHIVRKGKAGHINLLSEGDYTLNDDAYILAEKEDCGYELSLKWLVHTHRDLFFEYASSSDNSTWNKTGFFKHATFDIPDLYEQKEVLKRFSELEFYQKNIMEIYKKIGEVLNREPEDIQGT